MARYIISPAAEMDLLAIWLHIAADNPRAADEVGDRITAVFATLSRNPSAGRSRDDWGAGLRSLPVGSFIIVYRLLSDAIEIARVVHGARDLPGLF